MKYKKIRNIEPNSQEINLLGIKKRKNILVRIKKEKNILVRIKKEKNILVRIKKEKNILVQVLNCRRQFKKWV